MTDFLNKIVKEIDNELNTVPSGALTSPLVIN